MKAERRHELQHNELDDLLVQSGRFFRENAAMLGITAAVVVLAGLAYFFTLGKPMNADAGLWENYIEALSDNDAQQELDDFVGKHKDSSDAPVLWARLSLGNMKLAEGTRKLFDERSAAQESLEQAEKNFLAVEKHAGRSAELLDRAHYGLAQVYESQGKVDDATKYYKLVVKSSPESALGKIAAKGERRLSQPHNVEFLAWFNKQKPIKKPAGKLPFDLSNPPETPDFSLPPLDGSGDKPITPGFKIPSKPPGETTDLEKEPEPESKEEKPAQEPAGEKPE